MLVMLFVVVGAEMGLYIVLDAFAYSVYVAPAFADIILWLLLTILMIYLLMLHLLW
jgi:hypothetical protein